MKMVNRMWLVAFVPFVLMLAMFFALWASPSWANTASPVTCVLVPAWAFVTGLCVLLAVFAGWLLCGAYPLKRGDILAATLFASLDVLIPATLALLLWLLLRGLRNSPGLFF